MSPRDARSTGAPNAESRAALADALDHLLDPLERPLISEPTPTTVDADRPDDRPGPLRRGENAQATIAIRASEARKGGHVFVSYKVGETCAVCGGSGRRTGAEADDAGETICTNCDGTARVEVDRELSVHFPAGVSNGAQLRVRGEGGRPDGEGELGDLLLYVYVLPARGMGAWISRGIRPGRSSRSSS